MSINSPTSINRLVRGIFLRLLFLLPVLLPAVAYADQPRLLVLGDSLVAGYGLPPGQSLPDQ
ncbi:MAG: hypothetical protein VXB94_04840, partial [Rhodobiaceae bacterium]